MLNAATPDKSFGMFSAMVDEAWHAFVLFTTEYMEFGHRYFGDYIHHAPARERGAPDATAVGGLPQGTDPFDGFRQRYEELFGHSLPAVWYDGNSVAPSSRVINDKTGALTVVVDGNTIHVIDDTKDIVLSVNELAGEAVDFVISTHDFYVRELPGGLTEEEKVAMVRPLVRLGVLRLAP